MNFLIPSPRFRRQISILAVTLAAFTNVQAEPAEVLPPQELSGEMLFGLLVSEMALHYGDLQLSSNYYAKMAALTRDPRVARRALDVSQAAGLLPQSLEAARQWTQSAPASPDAKERYAALLLLSKREPEARELLQAHLLARPDRAVHVFTQLDSWLERGGNEKTERLPLVEALAANFKTLPEAHYALASAALNDNKADIGLPAIEKALKSRPRWAEAALVKGGLLQMKDPAAAIEWINSWQKRHGPHAMTNSYLARLYLTQDKINSARQTFERQINLSERDAYAPYAAGLIAREQKDCASAVGHLQRALERGYRDPDAARFYLGDCQADLKDIPAALRTLDAVNGPGDWANRALARSTLLRVRSGQADIALDKLRAARSNGASRELWQLEADVHREQGRLPEALNILGEGLKQFPDDDYLLYARAMVLDRLGKYAESEADLRQLLKKTPDDAAALNALGYMLADQGVRLEEARGLIEKAHALKPEDPFILDSLGWVYVRLGKLQQGLDSLQKAYAAQADPEIAAHLVENLWLMGRKDEARTLWQNATRKHPDHDALKNVQRKVLDKP